MDTEVGKGSTYVAKDCQVGKGVARIVLADVSGIGPGELLKFGVSAVPYMVRRVAAEASAVEAEPVDPDRRFGFLPPRTPVRLMARITTRRNGTCEAFGF